MGLTGQVDGFDRFAPIFSIQVHEIDPRFLKKNMGQCRSLFRLFCPFIIPIIISTTQIENV